MLKNVLFAVILVTSLTACKSKSAFKFSQDIAAKDKLMEVEGNKLQSKVQGFMAAKQYDSIAAIGERMEKLSQQQIDEINAMKAPGAKGAEEFKTASVDYFKYIKNIYAKFKDLGNAGTDEARAVVMEDMQKLVEGRDEVLSKITAAQQKYAKANGFKLEDARK